MPFALKSVQHALFKDRVARTRAAFRFHFEPSSTRRRMASERAPGSPQTPGSGVSLIMAGLLTGKRTVRRAYSGYVRIRSSIL